MAGDKALQLARQSCLEGQNRRFNPNAIGVGTIFGNFLSGALRNPSASDSQFGRAFIGAALAEGLGIEILGRRLLGGSEFFRGKGL